MRKYWTSSHTKHRLMYHLVWLPKYRRRVLEGAIVDRLRDLFDQCADMNRWEIKELNIQKDHVHMIVQLRQNISVSKAVQLLKGGSSKVIRSEFPELEEFLWGDNFWGEGFFAETVGFCNYQKIKDTLRTSEFRF